MIFWYKDLYMDEKVRKQEKKCKKSLKNEAFSKNFHGKRAFISLRLPKMKKIFLKS